MGLGVIKLVRRVYNCLGLFSEGSISIVFSQEKTQDTSPFLPERIVREILVSNQIRACNDKVAAAILGSLLIGTPENCLGVTH